MPLIPTTMRSSTSPTPSPCSTTCSLGRRPLQGRPSLTWGSTLRQTCWAAPCQSGDVPHLARLVKILDCATARRHFTPEVSSSPGIRQPGPMPTGGRYEPEQGHNLPVPVGGFVDRLQVIWFPSCLLSDRQGTICSPGETDSYWTHQPSLDGQFLTGWA